MDKIADRPYWELTFDKGGHLTSPDADQVLIEIVDSDVTELFIFSHGWATPQQSAQALYQAMFPMMANAVSQANVLGPIGFVGILWPSLWFPDPPAAAAPDVAEAVANEDRPGAADAALSGKEIADVLQASYEPGQQATIHQMGKLIDEGIAGTGTDQATTQRARLEEFHGLLQALRTPDAQPVEDSGESALIDSDNPQRDYQKVADILGSAPEIGAPQGIGDIFGKAWNGAKDALRIASYYEMKARAGVIGKKGLGPLLERLHERVKGIRDVRVHLIGHSFGARLVSFALAGISSDTASPVASLLLIQGAFSHFSFSHVQDMPFGKAGALNEYTDRVHGPLVATFSEFDWAVCRWYPKASFLAQEDDQGEDDPAWRWAGMGSDGFQSVLPADDLDMLPIGQAYTLAPKVFYRVDGATVINDTSQSPFSGAHSDIRHPEIAWLAASAAASASPGP
jgi:hypothetical protein